MQRVARYSCRESFNCSNLSLSGTTLAAAIRCCDRESTSFHHFWLLIGLSNRCVLFSLISWEMRPFKCFKRSVLEMETLAFVLSKDLTKGDIQCMWIPRRHRNRSLRHTVIQMPMNNFPDHYRKEYDPNVPSRGLDRKQSSHVRGDPESKLCGN